jgi:hypothetical protein
LDPQQICRDDARGAHSTGSASSVPPTAHSFTRARWS